MSSAAKPHFNEAAFKFLRSLKRNNDREWFNPRKPIYEAEVKAPMLALIGAINDAFADFAPEFVRDPAKCMMRIYRDTRFSKNKLPYKDHAAAWWARRGMEKTSGGGFYFDLSPTQITIAAGCYMPEREQLLAIRRHLLDRHEEFRKLAGSRKLKALGMTPLEPVMMTRPPKGFAVNHPAIDLIMQRQWGVSAHLPAEMALEPTLTAEVVKRFRAVAPLVSLLNEPLVPAVKAPLW
jgi:uncharacterized protein (TIGR02453 family)